MKTLEKKWKEILKDVIDNGQFNKKDDSKVLELLGYHNFIPNIVSSQHFLSQDPFVFQRYVEAGYFDLNGYPLNGKAIANYIAEFYNKDDIYCFDKADGFVYTYPERLLAMRTWDKNFGSFSIENQVDIIVERLIQNPGTNRAVATIYNCGLDKAEEDIPCLNWVQATIRDDKLTLHVLFRSNDIYGAWPSNMMFLMNLGFELVGKLKEFYPILKFNGIDYHVSSAHIYETDLDAVENILKK